MKTPTISAIETAVKNAAKMLEQGYTIKQSKAVPTSYHVIKPNKNGKLSYIVDTTPGFQFCQCEQFIKEGICKHQKFTDDHIAICQAEAENDERDAARYDLLAGKF